MSLIVIDRMKKKKVGDVIGALVCSLWMAGLCGMCCGEANELLLSN